MAKNVLKRLFNTEVLWVTAVKKKKATHVLPTGINIIKFKYQPVYLHHGKGTIKAERTRKFIVETTAPIFNKKGYAGTSLSDLTDATGLTKGSIYGNFANKEEVAAAAFDHNSAMIRKQIQNRIQKAGTYYEKLLVYAQVYHSFTRSGSFPEGGCPILNTAVDADDTNPLLKDKAAQAVSRWRKSIENLITAGIEAGEFKPDADISGTALSVIALIEGGIMIAKVTNTPASLDQVLKTVNDLISMLKTA